MLKKKKTSQVLVKEKLNSEMLRGQCLGVTSPRFLNENLRRHSCSRKSHIPSMPYNRLPSWLSFLGHQDDDKEPVKEQPKSEGTIASLQKSDETKEAEREDLVARFDRVVRGDPDETLQV